MRIKKKTLQQSHELGQPKEASLRSTTFGCRLCEAFDFLMRRVIPTSIEVLSVLLLGLCEIVGCKGSGATDNEPHPWTYHQDAEPGSKYSKEAATEAQSLKKLILASTKEQLGDHWAGEYYRGDGLGDNDYFAISPSVGFVFETYGCLGLYGRNFGRVTISNNVIQLTGKYPFEDDSVTEVRPEYISVAWGERQYLVEVERIIEFCNDINDGSEPRSGVHGRFLLKEGHDEKPVFGTPSLPHTYRKYILESPVTSAVTDH